MKTRLIPIHFQNERNQEFKWQVEAVLFPQLLGDAYWRLEEIKAIKIPMLIVTSEFGTVSMWDWEIRSYLRSEGVNPIAAYNLEQNNSQHIRSRSLGDIALIKR